MGSNSIYPIDCLFSSAAYPPFPGGGERFVRSLAQNLAGRGCRITVVTSTAQSEVDFWNRPLDPQLGKDDIDDSIRVIRCPLRGVPGGRNSLLAWRKLMVLVSELPGDQTHLLQQMARLVPPISELETTMTGLGTDFDLIHGFNISWEYPLVAAWKFAHRNQCPLIVTPFAHFGATSKDRVARNSTMDHQRRIMSEADALLTLTANEIARLNEHNILPRRAEVIGGGLDPLPPHRQPERSIARYGLEHPYALFIGRASHDKGALHAARAALALNRQELWMNLALVGQTSPEFERFYGGLRYDEKQIVRPLGLLSETNKHDLLEASAMLVLPSQTDSFGIVILEAWAHGKPVVGTLSGGIPDVVDDGKNGILVEFGDVSALTDAMRTLLTDPTLSKKMGERGRRKVDRHYSWESVGDRVMAVYEQVLKNVRRDLH